MKLYKLYEEVIRENLGYDKSPFDFKGLPEDIKETLFDEYDNYTHKTYDWNEKQDKLGNEFGDWLYNHENDVIWFNLNDIIRRVSQDMITLKRQKMVEIKLEAFEKLIKPVIGDAALMPALSKFEEMVLMNTTATPESIQKGFQDAKNIIDVHGNIDHTKIEQSEIFTGGDINYPAFERFAKNNSEYEGVYNDWKKLFDESTDLMLKDLNAYRSSTSIEQMRDLRNVLIDIKKKYKS